MPPMTPRTDTPAGGVIAGYEITRLLGRGGMGDVYLAFDPRLERPVALKVLVPQFAEDEEFRARLLRESRLAAGLDHPNVVPGVRRRRGGRRALHRHALRRRHRPARAAPHGGPARARGARSRSPDSSPTRSTPPTRAVSCTATSSRRTS